MNDRAPSNRPDIVEQTLYVPYSEDVLASVWCVDLGLQMFTNVPEDLAKANAVEYMDRNIYFFAEFAAEPTEAHILHRDAGTGQFVTEEFAEKNPETTVTERDLDN